MGKMMFDLNDDVVITAEGYFKGVIGNIVDVAVDSSNNTIYGVKVNESILYFLAKELDLI